MVNELAIVREARSWIGTPFHHQGRVKGIGCDCIGMVLGALDAVGLRSRIADKPFSDFDQADYAPDPNSKRLEEALDTHLDRVDMHRICAGDVVLFRVIFLPQHVGIIGNHPMGGFSLIHAYSPAGRVVEEAFSESWRKRVIGVYRCRGT